MADNPAPVPATPTDLRLVSIEKEKNAYFGTFEWTDNATDEFGTGFQGLDSSGEYFPWGAYSYPSEYGDGTGTRTARHRLADGEYDVYAYAESYIPPWPGVKSSRSNLVHVDTSTAQKGNSGKGSGK